jgi:hypothetical protein
MSHPEFFMVAPVYMIKSHPGPRKRSNLCSALNAKGIPDLARGPKIT